MVINGRIRKLKVGQEEVDGIVKWGVKSADSFSMWVSEDGGQTTSLSFHGRTFESQDAAQAYVDGYSRALRDFDDFTKGA